MIELISKLLPAVGGPVGKALSFLWLHKITIIVAGLVLGLCLYIMSLHNDIDNWKTLSLERSVTIEQLTSEIAIKNTNMDLQKKSIIDLEESIRRQNKAINDLNFQIQIKNQKIADLIKVYEEAKKKREQELAKILAEQRPTSCGGSIEYLIKSVGDLIWSK